MMSSRTLLKGAAIGRGVPGEVLQEVNDLLLGDNEGGMFVTVLYAVYNPAKRELTYSSGGHNSPLLVHADGTSSLLPLTDGVALGIVSGIPYGQKTVTLSPGDTVVLYTDGVTEAMNAEEEEFGLDPLMERFSASPPNDPEETTATVFDAVNVFAGETPQSDDITCLVLHCREESS